MVFDMRCWRYHNSLLHNLRQLLFLRDAVCLLINGVDGRNAYLTHLFF